MEKTSSYHFAGELANAISHGVGGLLAVAAIIILLVRACLCTSPEYLPSAIAGSIVFGVSLLLLYTSSTLYHALLHTSVRNLFLIFDHIAIYVLIAGTYTFFCLSDLYGPVGFRLLAEIWGMAILGILFFLFFRKSRKFAWISLLFYLAMGWLAVTEIRTFHSLMSPATFYLIVAGGLAYSVGSIFYALQKIKWMHFVWHIFVLAGSTLHVVAACCVH